jgi:hypothetical protein
MKPRNKPTERGLPIWVAPNRTVLECGLFDQEDTLPEELTQLRMGKIVRERYPELSEVDQEAIRQHAVAGINITQQAKLALAHADASDTGEAGQTAQENTTLLDGARKFVSVRDLDIDLIGRINPFEAAYAVLAKAMDEKSLRQVQHCRKEGEHSRRRSPRVGQACGAVQKRARRPARHQFC